MRADDIDTFACFALTGLLANKGFKNTAELSDICDQAFEVAESMESARKRYLENKRANAPKRKHVPLADVGKRKN